MSEQLDFYLKQQALIDVIPTIEGLRQEALGVFERLAFPNRKDEAWKYTSTDAFCQMRFELDKACNAPEDSSFPWDSYSYLMSGKPLHSGVLPAGVIIAPWHEALTLHAEKIAPFLGRSLTYQHGFLAQNTAMMSMGLFIYIPKGVCLAKPLRFINWQNNAKARYLRHLVVLEEGSAMTMMEDYVGDDAIPYYTNTVTEVHMHAQSTLKHYKLQREGLQAYHVGHLTVAQDKDTHFESHSLAFGGQWVRSDTQIQLTGKGARCLMNGIYLTRDKQHLDHHTLVEHQVPRCTSQEDYKGLITGASRAVFNGIVKVSRDAIGTVASQNNKNLLLSKQAEVNTKPQLEIDADDVVCTHGATVGQLDEEALFYLASRGLSFEESQYFLMRAFVDENLQLLGDAALSAWVSHYMNIQMGW